MAVALGRAAPVTGREHASLVGSLDSAAASASNPDVPGVSVAVVERGDILLVEGYGEANRASGVPTPPDTVYGIGSITKQLTLAAVLRLVERG